MPPLPLSLESQIEDLLSQLTLTEKCALLSGIDDWHTYPVPRLGIGSLVMTDGPHGVRAPADSGRIHSPATSFPTGVSMAASWNPDLIERVGEALAAETRALGCDVLLGPCVNLVRHPLAGRNFEAYSEDPYLAGRTGAAFVTGLQSRGVGASLKHYALNNQETERLRGSSEVDERTMRELYLAQFEMIVRLADPWTVMCAYNRINGEYASQHEHLLRRILKDEWGYSGAVISDWGSVHATAAPINAGLDLEMPGPSRWFGRLLVEAVTTWQIEPEVLDDAVRRILRLLQRAGKLPGAQPPLAGALNTPEHQALALELAAESLTLLKNSTGLLPLDAARLGTLAVIGPMAAVAAIGGGGSSFLQPPYRISPLDGLRELLGDQFALEYAPGCENISILPVISPDLLTPPDGQGHGLFGQYYASLDFSGAPLLERLDTIFDTWGISFAPLEPAPRPFSIRWRGALTPRQTGRHTFSLDNAGICRLYLDGQVLLENASQYNSPYEALPRRTVELDLTAGQAYDLQLEYIAPAWLDQAPLRLSFGYTPTRAQDQDFQAAVDLARRADVALVFAGFPEGHESEGYDRTSLSLTGRQDELIAQVAAANPRTVVVLNTGAPVAMPWLDQVSAVLHAYYPGQEGGRAVAQTLFGQCNPSGKLPVTFPRRLEDTPAFDNFPGQRTVNYGEGLFMGYRYYDHRQLEPLFPFGHGLSYTEFEYTDLRLPESAPLDQPLEVAFTVRNTGSRAGQAVPQVYVHAVAASLVRPPAELKSFAKLALQPGEARQVRLRLEPRAFAVYDPTRQSWRSEPGAFELRIGSSSRAIHLRQIVTLA